MSLIDELIQRLGIPKNINLNDILTKTQTMTETIVQLFKFFEAIEEGNLDSHRNEMFNQHNQTQFSLEFEVLENLTEQIRKKNEKPKKKEKPELKWLKIIKHPSTIVILGKKGSGKSALGYWLLEKLYYKYHLPAYVVGIPEDKKHLFPDFIGFVSSVNDAPTNSIILIDEAHLKYHSKDVLQKESRELDKILTLSRQREQTIIFVTQNAMNLSKNVFRFIDCIVYKEPSLLQTSFEREELRKIVEEASQKFEEVEGDKREWCFVVSDEFEGMLKNELASFWCDELSKLFADSFVKSSTKQPRALTKEELIKKAKELHQKGYSYGEIGKILGISKTTAFNYVNEEQKDS